MNDECTPQNPCGKVIHIRELIEELKRDLGMIEQETTE